MQFWPNFKKKIYICIQNPLFYKIHGTADSELSTLSLGLNLLCKSFQLLEFLAFYDNLGGYSHSWVSKSGGPTTYFSWCPIICPIWTLMIYRGATQKSLSTLGVWTCSVLCWLSCNVDSYEARITNKETLQFIGSNFWKFYLIKTGFTLGEPVSLVKVFRVFRLEWIFLVFRVWTQYVDVEHLIYWQGQHVLWCLVSCSYVHSEQFLLNMYLVVTSAGWLLNFFNIHLASYLKFWNFHLHTGYQIINFLQISETCLVSICLNGQSIRLSIIFYCFA